MTSAPSTAPTIHRHDLDLLISLEQAHTQRLHRVARGGAATDTILGGVAGAGLGLLGGVAMVAAGMPGTVGLLGMLFPLASGLTLAGTGTLIGSFLDLHVVSNLWRR